jgi:predicted AlkP superfamily phosphohydrolase/phosphomutase
MAETKRVVIIGWDSAPTDLFDEQWQARMPNLHRFLSEGTYGPLRSSDPPITVPAWTSMFSSRNPGALGFFGFRNRKAGEYAGKWIATCAAVGVPRIWDIASQAGKRCCVLNVPQTYPLPAQSVNGIMISSFLTPSTDSDYTYPPDLKTELDQVAGGYEIDCDNFRTDNKAQLLEDIRRISDKRFAVASHLLQKEPWDLFAMVHMGSDRIQHGFWKFHDPRHHKYEAGNPFENAIKDYYGRLDEQLGVLVDLAGDDAAVIIVSDHGAKRMKGSFNINDWLLEHGYLTLRQPVTEQTAFSEDLVDWPRTKAWAWGGYYSRIFMNVAGREPQGIIRAQDYETERDELIAAIEAIPDDQGRPMETVAHKAEDIYTGPYVADAPDLLVYFDALHWRAGQGLGNPSVYSFDTEIGPDDSVHDFYGIYASIAPGHPESGYQQGLHLMDVAPTVCRLLGIDTPAEMEGKSIYSKQVE